MPEPLRLVRNIEETEPAGAGGPRDFQAFFEDEYAGLFGALCLVTRNRHEAEEIAQDAFLKVWERWDRIGEMDSPDGYLYRTAMNAFRKRYRRTALALKSTLGIIPSDDAIEAVDARDATVRALAPLSDRQRAAVVLMDLLGYPSEEAARMLGVRPSTIRNHAARAHAALKHTMGGER